MLHSIALGCAAGALGTTALNAVTYADMALRGREPSSTPEQAVDAITSRLGRPIAGAGAERDNRLSGLGALAGLAVGCGVGSAVALTRRAGLRPRPWLGGLLTGALAMAATNLPMAGMRISDPRTWSTADWLADAFPHAAYGLVTYGVVAAGDRRRP